MSNILVVAEAQDGALKKATLTALTFARQAAARTGGAVHGLLIGHGIQDAGAELAKYVAVAHVADDEKLANPIAEAYAKVIAHATTTVGATVTCMAATSQGKDILPRAAALLNAGVGSDVLGFAGDDGLAINREMQAGNVVATVEITTDQKFFTTRPTEFDAAAPADAAGEVRALPVDLGEIKTRFVKFDAIVSERPALTDARVIIAGGRGLQAGEQFKSIMEPFADKLSAAIGASRAVVDAGWAANDLQIGQTGKVVAPDLYFALGISGAIQHVAGMKSSKTIVAVNKDPEAPIFQVADYGIVGDLFKVVPELVEKL